MSKLLVMAGGLSILLAVGHSLLGERLVLNRLMMWDGRTVDGRTLLSGQHLRVLRASWHLVTVFGLGFAATLLRAAWQQGFAGTPAVLAATFVGAAVYWLIATRGRHPAWIVLGLIGLLTALAQG